MITTLELDEGRFAPMCCLGCREPVRAKLGIAMPFRLYVAVLTCPECAEDLCQPFDVYQEVA